MTSQFIMGTHFCFDQDCMVQSNPKPMCKFMRYAEPEIVLRKGKRQRITSSPPPPQKKSKTDCCTASRDIQLKSNNWIPKRSNNKQHWLSPQRRLEFVSTRAAIDFQDARQSCKGNEFKAGHIFIERMANQNRNVSKLVIGGRSILNKSSVNCTSCHTAATSPRPSPCNLSSNEKVCSCELMSILLILISLAEFPIKRKRRKLALIGVRALQTRSVAVY